MTKIKIKPLANNTNDLMVGFLYDLNNLFTCAIGSLGLARLHDDDQPVQKEMIENASMTVLRATELTSLMMVALRGHDMPKEPVDIRDIVREAAKLAKQTINAEIDLDMLGDCCPVNVNTISIINVFLNLLLNADREIDGSETIQVRCSTNDGIIFPDDKRIPPMVRICVVYSKPKEMNITEGVLKSEIILQSLRPHGIGLRMVSTIIEQHGGSFTLLQEEDQGITAEICLPMIQSSCQQ